MGCGPETKKRIFFLTYSLQPTVYSLRNVAGADGFEPPYGGIKTRSRI